MRNQASYVSIGTAITLLIAAVGGGAKMGALASEVEDLQQEQTARQEERDRLVKVEQKVENIENDLDEVKADTKAILDAVREIQAKQDED